VAASQDVDGSLDGKVVVVTGASRGIGKGLALGLARLGAAVVCAARTVKEEPGGLPGTIHNTVDAIRAEGGRAVAVRCDIGDADDIQALIDATVAELGRLDVLVNNAMASTRALFADATPQQWDESMRVNVRSLFVSAKAVVPVMAANGGGSIVNISSGAAGHDVGPYMPPGYLVYTVAKAALERFSTALAAEVAPLGIAVNALRPGAVKTELSTHELGDDYDWSGWKTPDSVVGPVAFLAAQTGSGLTGRVLDVAGFGREWGRAELT
jgi:NAD(P)-dependent dehydrogenase (short-subunit alcohol dehydrogenase family)